MPVTWTEVPILSQFFSSVAFSDSYPSSSSESNVDGGKMAEPRAQQPPNEKEKESQPLPKGVVLGKDGKP